MRQYFALIRHDLHGLFDLRLVTELIASVRFQIVIKIIHSWNSRRNIEFQSVCLARIFEVLAQCPRGIPIAGNR